MFLYILISLFLGAFLGFMICKRIMKKTLKNYNPYDVNIIKKMLNIMGYTPTQKQLNILSNRLSNMKK